MDMCLNRIMFPNNKLNSKQAWLNISAWLNYLDLVKQLSVVNILTSLLGLVTFFTDWLPKQGV